MSSSPTSSSRSEPRRRVLARLPWGGFLGVALLLAADAILLGDTGPWAAIAARDPFGLATPRSALQQLRAAPPELPRVAVVGPSRVWEGFSWPLAEEQLPGVAVRPVAHPRFDPFVILQLTDEIAALRPALVVFLWSEADSHRPVRLEPVPGSSGASLAALADLLHVTDLRFAIERRVTLYRLALSSLLNSYRYRTVLNAAGLNDLYAFRLGRLKPFRGYPKIYGDPVIWDAEAMPVAPEERRRIVDSFGPEADARFVDLSTDFVVEITPGDHASAQMTFMRRAVERLTRAGTEVLIVEGPLHPLAYTLYERERLRAEFLAFAEALAEDPAVHLVRLDDMRFGFEAGDFKDLIHAGRHGTPKLTTAIADAVRQVLGGEVPARR